MVGMTKVESKGISTGQTSQNISFAYPPDSSTSFRKEIGPPLTSLHGDFRVNTYLKTDRDTERCIKGAWNL